ncbi:hypothetical protein [Mesorhizobium sp. Root552]|uniref:hypothetical protein n=1 Tax=Mesorhizobium sp. Root552 TaxID=1736555 RepID=UPI000A7125AF|nr:hypothetical protein [Mesorhizobium sp. Root552]
MGALKYIAGAVAAALLAGGASAQELRKDVLYTLPIESTKNRVEALHVTLVCEYLGNVDKAINLHNAKQTDMVYCP